MGDQTKLVSAYLTKKIARYEIFSKYLMMPRKEVVGRLVDEKEAKDRAYRFIEEKGLMCEFAMP